MKFLIYFFLSVMAISGCINHNTDGFKEECPYDFAINAHLLKVPVVVIPHKMTYAVGDTIRFVSQFSDFIEDVGAQERFLIQEFPFEPLSLLFRIKDEEFNFESGYTVNTHQIDERYKPTYFKPSKKADAFRAVTQYENGTYQFEHALILEKPGRYIMMSLDIYAQRKNTGNEELNAQADAIEFEGKCNRIPMNVVTILEGDDHMEAFMEELLFLDDNVYGGQLFSRDQGSTGPLDVGVIKLEFNGLFCFEVME